MYIYVLPVSGAGFVSQLAILQHLCEAGYIPDLTLASSGGNVAAYIAAAANWKWAGIERIAREMTQDLFAKPLSSISWLSFILGYFNGNAYNKGTGVYEFLCRYFCKESICKHEIWTGTYNKAKQKTRLFCNKNEKDTILEMKYLDKDLTQSMDPYFADGDIRVIADAGVASASIPGIVPAQKIDDEYYIDGGVSSSSPLIVLKTPILKYVAAKKAPLHIFYINSVDLGTPNSKPGKTVIEIWKQATQDLIRSQTVIDRLASFELLRSQTTNINKEEFPCTYSNLQRVKQIQERVQSSLIEIYPYESMDKTMLNLGKFGGEEVVEFIRKTYPRCGCRFWYIETNDEEVPKLLEKCRKKKK